MKILFTLLLTTSLSFFSQAATNGYYWIVESTTCSEGPSIIRVYDHKHELVYTEKIEGKLDVKNKKIHRHLNRKVRKLKALREKA